MPHRLPYSSVPVTLGLHDPGLLAGGRMSSKDYADCQILLIGKFSTPFVESNLIYLFSLEHLLSPT